MDDQSDRRGWVKLWRKWCDHEMASDPNATLVFLHLLTSAALDTYVNRRFGYTVQRGECDLTISQLAQIARLSRGAVREALTRLVKYGTITRSPRHAHCPSITTIVNFNTYNHAPGFGEHETTTEQPLNSHRTTRLEEVKKLRSTTAPAAIELPDELRQYEKHVQDWLAYKRERHQTYKPRGLQLLFKKMVALGPGLPSAVEESIANNYAGLFEARGGPRQSAPVSKTAEQILREW